MFLGELAVLKWLESLRSPALNTLLEAVTFFGEDTVFIVVIAVLYFMFHKESAYRLCFLTLCSLGLNGIVKNIFKIPRPFSTGKVTCVRPETATGYSFPSGHTQNFATWSTAGAKMLRKKWLWVMVLILSAMMGFSRLYLGAHYPSDVIVGLIFGCSAGYFGSILYERVKNPEKLYWIVFSVMTGIALVFLIQPDPLFADYFKCVGLTGGLTVAYSVDKRWGNLSYRVPFAKKLLRVALAVGIALIFKKGLEAVSFSMNLSLSLIWDLFRYFVLVTAVFGIYPLLLQKLKL